MWIVRLALRRPYTFVVMALVIFLLGIVTIRRMSTDIFPEINIPVVSVIWSFAGMSPEDMERRIVTITERAMTTTVNDIEHIESQSMQGVSVVKVFFHPGAKIEAAVAQITSIMQTILCVMPPGIQPPPDQTLLPGMYAQVKLSTARATPPLLVPSNALVIRADGPQVATVQQDQTVRYQKVQVERDYGTEVEIFAGLNGDEALVVNPTNDLREGAQVHAVAGQQKAK
jgi:Cu/Ag efflux pump CusA